MIEIQVLSKENVDEMRDLISVFQNVFEMKDFIFPHKNHLLELLLKDNFIAITVKLDGKVIGGLTVHILEQYYSTQPLAYIFDLAISTDHQRKGIGRELIEYTCNYCRKKGIEEIFVQADQIDDYALQFYRATNPTNEEQVIHFTYNLKDNFRNRPK